MLESDVSRGLRVAGRIGTIIHQLYRGGQGISTKVLKKLIPEIYTGDTVRIGRPKHDIIL